MKMTAKDLRFHSKRVLEAVAQGEEVIITYRGKPRARIVPIDLKNKKDNKTKSQNLFGIWNDKAETIQVEQYVRNIRKGRF